MRALFLAAAVALPSLPSLPVLARVRIEVSKTHVVVVQDVRVERGDWTNGDLDLYVAFGAPGVPRAIDAQLIALEDGGFFATDAAPSEPIALERQTRRPPKARLLLGREAMAGVVAHVREPALRRAFAASGALVLRVRSLVPSEGKERDLVVRVGADGGAPIAIGPIEVAADARSVVSAEIKLCGPSADPYPLAFSFAPARPIPITYPRPLAPWLAQRREGDDLCVRLIGPDQ